MPFYCNHLPFARVYPLCHFRRFGSRFRGNRRKKYIFLAFKMFIVSKTCSFSDIRYYSFKNGILKRLGSVQLICLFIYLCLVFIYVLCFNVQYVHDHKALPFHYNLLYIQIHITYFISIVET